MNKMFLTLFDIGQMVWQRYWIEGKILNNVDSGTATSINVKLHKFDLTDMVNVRFKFQPDRPHGSAAILD